MRLSSILLGVLLPAVMAASAPRKSVIITFPDQTPDSVVDQAKKAIKDAGGVITHEYNLIKGFAAETPETALNTVSTLGSEYPPVIEDDQVVSINPPSTN